MPFEGNRVAAALLASWSLKTSGQWLATNPERGQCNVTVLINELFGGQILETPLPEGSHFYNRIDGQRIDLTDAQWRCAPTPDRAD